MARYESEHTQFMRTMMEKNPEWARDQLAGLGLLWEKKVSLAEQARLRESAEANRPYPYDVNFS